MIILSHDKGVTWRTLSEFGLVALRGQQHGLQPAMRPRVGSVPGRPGNVYYGAIPDAREIIVPLLLQTSNPRELQAKAREFLSFLVDGSGNPRELRIVFEYDPDKFYSGYCVDAVSLERFMAAGSFSLRLAVYDPFAYLTDYAHEITLDSDLMLDSDYRLDEEYAFEVKGNTTIEVNNFGTLAVAPIVEISGILSDIELVLEGKTMSYNESLAAGTLAIDCAKMTAKVAGQNKLNKLSGSFLELQPGVNNISINGTALNCTVSFIFRPKYL